MIDKKTPPPPEAVRLGHCFYLHDYKWGIVDFPQWTKKAIEYARLASAERAKVKQYLADILDSSDDAALGETWRALGTAVVFVPPGRGVERSFLDRNP